MCSESMVLRLPELLKTHMEEFFSVQGREAAQLLEEDRMRERALLGFGS